MLRIKVNERFLHIPKGTSIQVEMNNALFDTDKVEGDVIYTFDIPAERNNTIFDNANNVYVSTKRKFDCIVYVGGIEIAHGDLYIQSATIQTYSIGIVMNPYPGGWADDDMTNDDFGDDMIISTHLDAATRKAEFLQFLKQTVADGSIVKFPLFYDEKFYGDGNKDFGFFISNNDTPDDDTPSGKQASLHTSVNDSTNFDKYYVNRLFIDDNGNVIEELNATNRGIRVFNREDVCNGNSFAFAPAINLLWMLEKVCKSAGYSMHGNFSTSEAIKKIYHQSLFALDGDLYQGNAARLTIDRPIERSYYDARYAISFLDTDNNSRYAYIKALETGAHQISVDLQFYLEEGLKIETVATSDYYIGLLQVRKYIHTFDILVIALYESGSDIVQQSGYNIKITASDLQNQNYLNIQFCNAPQIKAFAVFDKNNHYYPLQNGMLSDHGNGIYQLHTSLDCNLQAGHYYDIVPYIMKCEATVEKDLINGDYLGDPVYLTTPDNYFSYVTWLWQNLTYGNLVFNTFANSLHFADHVPSLTNSEFLNSICNAFGLNFFINSSTKEIELSFFKDIANAQSLDLSDYLLDKETTIEKIEDQIYKFKLKTELEEDIEGKEQCGEVLEKHPVPPAKDNVGKVCFIQNLNKFQIAERIGSYVMAQYYGWKDYAGNVKTLEVGDKGDVKEIEPKITIPYMRSSWNNEWAGGGTDTHIIPQIESKGVSRIFNTGESKQDFILVNCHGLEKIKLETIDGGGHVYYELSSPVCWPMNPADESTTFKPGINLTPTGHNSMGETYVRPMMEILQGHTKVTAKFLLPLYKFLETAELLKPQKKLTHLQTRWVLIGNTKLLPIKMTFEFAQGRDEILAEIEMALPKMSIQNFGA